ncbi:MAG: putative nucleoside permease NupX [Haliscomenobacter sp.]|jgi:CNT family concentrative nucleoside transporter|nr:putative nucleoside permease NupX [Haliscomenobacter sp.]
MGGDAFWEPFMALVRAFLGMGFFLLICYLLSVKRSAINWRTVGSGIVLQILLAILILRIPGVSVIFDGVAQFFQAVLRYSEEGAAFLFSGLVKDQKTFGYIFAFQVLPTIVFFSSLAAILFHLGILQKIIYGLAWLMKRTMKLSGPESLAAAANVFIGQTEAPLLIRPYLGHFTRSEMMCLMTGGMATIAGGVFAAYVGFLGGSDPEQQLYFAKHLLAASVMSAPAAIVTAKILVPETDPKDLETQMKMADATDNNLLDAIARGTTDGLRLAINVGAMLLVFTALVFMLNQIMMGFPGKWLNVNETIQTATNGRFEGLTFTYILGWIFAPFAWIMGVPNQDVTIIGQLLGMKTMINEFVAYAELGNLRMAGVNLHPKSTLIATYALCGFSNFASIGIQIGGISALVPSQRKNLTELGLRALVGGTIACFMTAIIAGAMFEF